MWAVCVCALAGARVVVGADVKTGKQSLRDTERKSQAATSVVTCAFCIKKEPLCPSFVFLSPPIHFLSETEPL